MAGEFTYPGVYIQELPSLVHTISGVPTAITAFVGDAARGPADDPVIISSIADYDRTFGGDGSLPLDQAVSLFFQNGGADAIVVRITPKGTKVKPYTLPTGQYALPIDLATQAGPPVGTPPQPQPLQLLFQAQSPGLSGNNLWIIIDQDNLTDQKKAKWYNLTVEYKLNPTDPPTIKERYTGISIDPASSRTAQKVLASSSLVTVVTQPAPPPPPATPPPAIPPSPATPPAQPPGPLSLSLPMTAAPGKLPEGQAKNLTVVVPPNDPIQQPVENDLAGDPGQQTGLYAVAKHNTFFNMLVLTPVAGAADVALDTLAKAAAFVKTHRAMLIADAPQGWATVDLAVAGRDTFFNNFATDKTNVAVYFPRLVVTDSTLGTIPDVGSSAAVAGLHALTDASRGVWKAAAGIAVQLGGADLSLRMSDAENGRLNPLAVNCLRSLPVVGNVIWGARTADGDEISESQWKYIPIRRLALYIEESLYRGTQWVVFEPNDEPLWAQVRLNVGAFMHTLFRQGAFKGTTAKEAYFVKCDADSNPQVDIDNGILNAIVGFAPLKPAEFVVIKIQQIAGQIAV